MSKRGPIALLFCLITGIGLAQFSPGELSEPHKHLEGLSNCTQCHSLGAKVSKEKCLDCHTALKQRINSRKGFHSSSEVKGKACISCHSEHHGRRFDAIRLDTDKFDHRKTGYRLQGGHSKVECRDCHTAKNIDDPELRKNDKTYLGLDQACLSCHTDTHQGTLSKKCLECHGMTEFKTAPKFKHGNASFPLKGKHASVSCIDCHKVSQRNGQRFQEFADVPHANCTDCHKDPHAGSLGNRCTACHTESSWTSLKQGVQFDHSKTRYPLEGLHATVDCKECHKTGHRGRLPHAQCLDCHSDYHQGEFRDARDATVDCRECHSVMEAFNRSSFGLERHQQGSFPLEDAHAATSCIACHKPEANANWSFRFESTSCTQCHQDVHGKYLDPKFMPDGDCKACHGTQSWNRLRFDHSATKFPLDGAHMETNCRACHFKEERDADGLYVQEFANRSTRCSTCHEDRHAGQFEKQGETDCKRCHSTEPNWPTPNFNHAQTQFPLDGRHAEIKCDQCHVLQGDNAVTLYRIAKFQCIDCHK